MNSMLVQNKRPLIIAVAIGVILLIPFIAMQFTDEVNWTIRDFIVAAIILSGTGFLFEVVVRNVTNTKYRLVLLLTILVGLVLLWAELAVGIFGSPIAGS